MMLTEGEDEGGYLGQFIPLHYHHSMLMDGNRMKNFKAAIDHVVFPGAKVLEYGGGTGVLSWFAAAKAEKVWCVEYNPDLVREARRLLAYNTNGNKVEVVHANAFEYLPPEPVDVMICEMIHVALLREKQIEMLESFKQRYRQRFGERLPTLIPTAVVMAVQPLQIDYTYEGYVAPIVQVQELAPNPPGTVDLAQPGVYSILDYSLPMDMDIAWEGDFVIECDGVVNSLRFITKNILAMVMETSSTIDWLNRYMAFPLHDSIPVKTGDILRVRFNYRLGGLITSLQETLRAEVVTADARISA
jgi:type I protein arginine methyltransferase